MQEQIQDLGRGLWEVPSMAQRQSSGDVFWKIAEQYVVNLVL